MRSLGCEDTLRWNSAFYPRSVPEAFRPVDDALVGDLPEEQLGEVNLAPAAVRAWNSLATSRSRYL